MKILFPNDVPTVASNKTDRDVLRRAEAKLRHAGICPGYEKLAEASQVIREFVDEQEKQAEDELEELANDEPPASA